MVQRKSFSKLFLLRTFNGNYDFWISFHCICGYWVKILYHKQWSLNLFSCCMWSYSNYSCTLLACSLGSGFHTLSTQASSFSWEKVWIYFNINQEPTKWTRSHTFQLIIYSNECHKKIWSSLCHRITLPIYSRTNFNLSTFLGNCKHYLNYLCFRWSSTLEFIGLSSMQCLTLWDFWWRLFSS